MTTFYAIRTANTEKPMYLHIFGSGYGLSSVAPTLFATRDKAAFVIDRRYEGINRAGKTPTPLEIVEVNI